MNPIDDDDETQCNSFHLVFNQYKLVVPVIRKLLDNRVLDFI
jgi:hypothetical protein